MVSQTKTDFKIHDGPGLVGLLVLALFASGCGILVGNPEDDKDDPKKNQPDDGTNPDDPNNPNNPNDPGQTNRPAISFNITDAPVDDAKHLYVTIVKVEIFGKDDKWTDIPLVQAAEFDLLALQNGEALKIAKLDELAPGTYTNTRLVLSEEKLTTIVLADDTSYPVKVPSGSETGLKINQHFTVEEGKPLELTIDFDLRKSLFEVGNSDKYHLKPVLRMIANEKAGAVKGNGGDKGLACLYAKETTPDATSACENAITTSKVRDGSFKLAFIPEGTYTVRVFTEGGAYTDYDNVAVIPKQEVELKP